MSGIEQQRDKIVPSLWVAKGAEEAARFYTSIFPGSRIERVTAVPAETPSGPPGSVIVVELRLFGQPFLIMEAGPIDEAGPLDSFNHAISFTVNCEDQGEIDRYWEALLRGGKEEQCGWLKDRFGVSWQIVPRQLADMTADADRDKARRATEAMLKMKKLDLAALRAAFNGGR